MSVAEPIAVPSPPCRVCRKPLPLPAPLKCPECKEYQGRCGYCGQAVPPEANRCNGCKAFLDGDPCWSCGAPVQPSARCGVCNSSQGLVRRWFPDSQAALALLIALISILTAIVPRVITAWNYGSDTRVRIIGTEEVKQKSKQYQLQTNAIRIAATNGGTGNAAVVRKASIAFDPALEIADADLDLANPEDTLVLPGETRIVKWILGAGLERMPEHTKTRDEVLGMLRTQNVTITVWVEEARTFRKPRLVKRTDSVPGDQVYAFMDEHTP